MMKKHLIFVQKLKEHKTVLSTSQVQQIKVEKEITLKVLVQQYKDL